MQKKEEDRRIVEDQAAKDRYWKIPICYDDEDYAIAITPVLSPEEPVDSLIMEDEHLDAIPATKSNEVIKSSVENLVQIPSASKGISNGGCDVPLCDNPTPLEAFKEHSKTIIDSNNDSTSNDDDYPYGEDINYVDASPSDAEIVSLEVVEIVIPKVRGVDTDILLTIKHDILREKLLNVNLLIANIKALKDNHVPSSDFVIKSPSTFPNSFLEETNTFDNSLTEYETFRFNLEEISSGSTTTLSNYSLPDYEVFNLDDDHIEEKSSGSTTTHADFSQYNLFIFDLSINPFPPADRSDFYHEEFADELAHIISPPECDCFYFKNEPELGDFTMDVVGDIYPTREPRVHVPNVLPTHPTLDLDLDFILLSEPLFTYIIWIFLPFFTYPVTPPYLLSCGNEDTIFDPGIPIYHSFMPGYPDFEDSRAHDGGDVVILVSVVRAVEVRMVRGWRRNKKDKRGIVIKNKARLVAQGYTQEEEIDYDEVFAPIAIIKAIRLFLAYASFKDFVVYQMDVKSAFLYRKIEEEVNVCQPSGFEDPDFPDRRGKIDKTLFIRRIKSDILLVQVYVNDIIFGSTKKSLCIEFEKMMHKKFQMSSIASTPMETQNPLLKDADGEDVDEHLYRSMIGSLMYLTSSRPDIMFTVCACARFQVNPKSSHLHAVKRIFRYLKGQPKLGLWYPKDSPFDLVAYTDSDYAGASLDRKSTTGAEYIAASNCCGQVLWIQNQLLDYGYNFMQTKIHIDNESTICIVKNPVFHSKIKHIEIRHHFIRDSYEKKLIQMIKIHTYQNVADFLTKAIDVSRFQYLIASIRMLNL
ncbi:putative reverse transcriptase, RNA-dependent DNA polymerase [Tanacetum coccineum]